MYKFDRNDSRAHAHKTDKVFRKWLTCQIARNKYQKSLN